MVVLWTLLQLLQADILRIVAAVLHIGPPARKMPIFGQQSTYLDLPKGCQIFGS